MKYKRCDTNVFLRKKDFRKQHKKPSATLDTKETFLFFQLSTRRTEHHFQDIWVFRNFIHRELRHPPVCPININNRNYLGEVKTIGILHHPSNKPSALLSFFTVCAYWHSLHKCTHYLVSKNFLPVYLLLLLAIKPLKQTF